MSDALQVAKWLRNLAIAQTSNGISEPSGHVAWTGADALEAQAKEIAEKDARISSWEQDNEVLGQLLSAKVKDNEKLCARIAELEAMRKRDMDCVKRASIRISELERRAALKGERG